MRRIILSFVLMMAMLSCNREIPNPVSNPVSPDIPPTPSNIIVEVGDRFLYLTWDIADSSDIAKYRVFRADSIYGSYSLIDSSETADITIGNLSNGRPYFFEVAAVNTVGVEGRKSAAGYGTPNLYSLIINEGNPQTDSRNVILMMVAPGYTSLMRVANDSLFSQSSWEPFSDTKPWLLTADNGPKTVYVMFRDGDGNTTHDLVSDNITYEMLDYQYSITVNGDAELAFSRDVEIQIIAPSGTSYMKISNSPDFSNAQWEGFSTVKQWHIPSMTAVNRDTVGFYALFRDSNGDSVSIEAVDSIILAAADPVELLPIYQQPDNYQTVLLQWSRTFSADFYGYRIFRSRGSASPDSIIGNLFDESQTSYSDNLNLTDLPDETPDSIYYMLRFYSVYDDSADSDPVLAVLRNNRPPTLFSFINDINYDIDTLTGIDVTATFGWSRSEIHDFAHYVIYENTSLDTITAVPIYFEYEQGLLSYGINKNNVDTLDVYYYWLKVFDLGGQASGFSAPDSVYY